MAGQGRDLREGGEGKYAGQSFRACFTWPRIKELKRAQKILIQPSEKRQPLTHGPSVMQLEGTCLSMISCGS